MKKIITQEQINGLLGYLKSSPIPVRDFFTINEMLSGLETEKASDQHDPGTKK